MTVTGYFPRRKEHKYESGKVRGSPALFRSQGSRQGEKSAFYAKSQVLISPDLKESHDDMRANG